ncbi:TauD/TfdA family dioxygenase [uncultured Nostoc sp.]|uniref:TauD/TfdA family dioxygenase n=1 Tax=uncultured Nostoc sp. TaxID=340711 RepID=UPI0035CA97D8
MKNLKNKKSSSIKLETVRRKTINLSEAEFIKIDFLTPWQTLPIILKPNIDYLDLADWIESSQNFIETNLLKYGAILFRGFNVDTAPAFERVCLTLCSDLFNENGEHPRKTVSGNVYTPVSYPADKKLLWHNENSFNYCWPRKILFGCLQPAQQGGETPIVDSRIVFQLIDPQIRERFIDKKVMYIRNYGDGLGLNWETVFQTSDRLEVEAACTNAGIDFEWKTGNRLRTRVVRPAVVKHPQTEEMSWFNQAQHWHPACLDSQTRESLLSMFKQEDLPRNCYYGDGSPIEDSVMQEICAVYQHSEVSFPWQSGDLLILDNLLTAHGRNSYVGERQLLVAMGEMAKFDDI